MKLIGDIPIFVAHDSADVWSRPDLFFLDKRGRPTVQAGVPPDSSARRDSSGETRSTAGKPTRRRASPGGSAA